MGGGRGGQDVGQDGGRRGCHGMSSLRCRGRMASCWGGGCDGKSKCSYKLKTNLNHKRNANTAHIYSYK